MIYPPRKMAHGEHLTAANYNALLDYIRRITPVAGANVKVDYRLGGAVISGTPGGVAADREVKPFAVRHHEGQWEIYLPDGCCNYGGACAPINAAASTGGTAHGNDGSSWRLLKLDESSGTTGTDADNNTYREWNVEIHVKPSAKMYGVDDLNNPARRLVWACAVDRLKSAANLTDAERYSNTPGDSWSCVVARIRVTAGAGTDPSRTVTQLRNTPVDVAAAGETLTGFGLEWYFSLDNGELQVEKVYCMRQVFAVAGMTVTGDQMTEVTDANKVFARIGTADMTSGTGLVTVESDPEGTTTSGDFVTWLPLYELKENTVTADYRENSMRNVQLYRA